MKKSKLYFMPGTVVTIDERMISYRGRSKDIVFETSKPIKCGFRSYILADLKTDYSYEMKLLEHIEEKQNKTKVYTLVTEFMNELTLKSKKKYILSSNGLYLSEELLDCKEFYFIVAIRANRIKSNRFEILEKIEKKHYEYFYRNNDDINYTLIKYNDSRYMFIVSNFVIIPEEAMRTRWSKKDTKFITEKYPNTIKKYSQFMEGLDKSNQLISFLR